MGIEVELMEQLKVATEAIKAVAEALTINANGSINVNELAPVQIVAIKDALDPNKKALVDDQGRLLVSAISGNPGLLGSVKIEDGINSNKKALVDDSGRLLVSTPPPTPPPDTDPIVLTGFGQVSGDVDQNYTITNGKTLVIGRLLAGAQGMNKAGRITLYEDPDGTGTTLNVIAVLYVNADSDIADLSEKFVGNGSRRVILRRSNLGGGSAEMFARFEGYEE